MMLFIYFTHVVIGTKEGGTVPLHIYGGSKAKEKGKDSGRTYIGYKF
jgi:hypothetical protein